MPKKYKYQQKINIIDSNGDKKRITIYADTKQQLFEKIEQRKAKAQKDYEQSKKKKFKDVADAWNEAHEKEIEYNTYSSYQAPIKDLKAEFGEISISEITAFELQAFLNTLKKQGYARQTINLRKIALNQIFNYAILNGEITNNPCAILKVPTGAEKQIVEIPDEKTIKLIKQNVDVPGGLLPYLIMFTGCRKGEALALKFEDIDFKNNLITINKSVYYQGSVPCIKTTKTKNGVRTIPLLTPLKNVLDQNSKGYIFSKDGELYHKQQIVRQWNKYKKATGVDSTLHQLRHAFASFCFDAGLEEFDTAKIMGHSKIETTKNIYTHIRESRQKVTTSKLEKYVQNYV